MAAVPWEVDDTQPGAAVPWEVDDTKPKGKALPKSGAQIIQDASRGNEKYQAKDFATGAKHAWDRAAYGLEKLATGAVAPEHQQEIIAGRAADKQAGLPATAGGMAFDMVANPMGKAKLVGSILRSAGYGALTNHAEDNAGAGAIAGGVGAGLGGVAAKGIGRIANPTGYITPEKQALMTAGVPLTPGQAGTGGMASLESVLERVPLLKSIVHARQKESTQALAGLYGKKMGIDVEPGATGQEVLKAANDAVEKGYSDAIVAMKPDGHTKFAPDMTIIKDQLNSITGVNPAIARATAADIVKQTAAIKAAKTKVEAGHLWKALDADLGALGDKFSKVKDTWRSAFHDIAGPEASHKMLNADLTFRQAEALKKGIGFGDTSSPLQLVKGLRRQAIDPEQVVANAQKYIPDASNLGAKAQELNQLGEGANQIMSSKPHPLGMASQIAAALGAGGLYSGAVAIPAMAGVGMGTAAGLYTKKVLPYATGQLGKSQRAIATSLREGTTQQVAKRAGAAYANKEKK